MIFLMEDYLPLLQSLSFTNKIGMEIFISENFQNDAELQYLFAEETGVVVQFHNAFEESSFRVSSDKKTFEHRKCASQRSDALISISLNNEIKFSDSVVNLEKVWNETSYSIKSLRDNPASAKAEYDLIETFDDQGLVAKDSFQFSEQLTIF